MKRHRSRVLALLLTLAMAVSGTPALAASDEAAALRPACEAYLQCLEEEQPYIEQYSWNSRPVALTDITDDGVPELIYMRAESTPAVTLRIATFRDGELVWLYSDGATSWDGQVGGGFAHCLFKTAGDTALYAYLRPPFETEGHIGFSRFEETADGTLKRTPVCMENFFISHEGGYNESVTYLVDGAKGTEQDYLERAGEIGSSVTEVFQSTMGSWEDEGLPGQADLQSLCSAMTCEEAIAYLNDLAAGKVSWEDAAAQSGRTEVDAATLPDSLNAFLKQFIDWYGTGGNYASDSYYDCEHAADGSSNIMAGIVNCVTPSIVDFSLYPGVMPEEHMSMDDWYVVYDGPTADWVAKNIFNVPDGDLDTLVRQAEEQGWFRLDGMDDGSYQYISPIIGGIGDTGTEVRLSSAEFDGEKYYVVYDLYQVWFTTDGKDEYLSSYYAELEYKDIDGQSYWSMYRNSKDIPPEAKASADGWLGRWYADTGEYLDIRSVSDTGISMVFHIIIENGEFMDSPYELEFDNGARTVASEMGGPEDHGSWEYTFILGDGYITVQSRYPDQVFTKGDSAPYSGTITVTADDVNIRSGPGTYYARLGEADRGARFTATGRTGGWYQIDYYGTTAYIIEDYVTEGDSAFTVTADSGTLTVTANDVNIRTGPGTGYESIGKVSYGVPFAITGKIGNWYQIDYYGTTAYIIGDYVVIS